MTENAPAGWYPQADGQQRYWDGQKWTEHFAPGTAAQAAAAAAAAAAAVVEPAVVEPAAVEPTVADPTQPHPVSAPAPAPAPAPAAPLGGLAPGIEAPDRPWWKKKRFIIPGAALVFVLMVSALASGGDDDEPVPTPPADLVAESPAASPSASASATELPTTFVMPDLVGANLQEAQDMLQSLGSYLLDQEDASGQDRMQLDDSNWQVCTQDPAAGTEVPVESTVLLASVKLDESCDGKAVEEEPAAEEEPASLTTSQEQAVRSAEEYLAVMAFSRVGLIEQLQYEGFSKADAKFAVDSLHEDWNEQAAAMAQNYLDTMSFSRSGLIEQLEYEGFSHKQAVYGVDSTGL